MSPGCTDLSLPLKVHTQPIYNRSVLLVHGTKSVTVITGILLSGLNKSDNICCYFRIN